jgi:hypothetical protein
LRHVPTRWSSVYNCLKSVLNQLSVILVFLGEDFEKYPSQKVKNLIENIEEPMFIADISSLYILMEKPNITTLKFQEEDIDIGSVDYSVQNIKKLLSSDELNDEVKEKIDDLTSQFNSFLSIKKKLKINKEIEVYDISTEIFKKIILKNFNERFTSTNIIWAFAKVFHPRSLRGMENEEESWKDRGILFARLVKHFTTKISFHRYKQKIQHYNIIHQKIIPNLQNLNSFSDTCNFILKDYRFASFITAVRLTEIGLLIPSSSSVVEGGFSILNSTQDENTNRLDLSLINFIMICKINITNLTVETLLDKTATNWLYGQKKRRGLKI